MAHLPATSQEETVDSVIDELTQTLLGEKFQTEPPFFVNAPFLWNDLSPDIITNSSSLLVLKHKLKCSILNNKLLFTVYLCRGALIHRYLTSVQPFLAEIKSFQFNSNQVNSTLSTGVVTVSREELVQVGQPKQK